MISSFELYLLSVIHNIDMLLNMCFFGLFVVAIFLGMYGIASEDEERRRSFSALKKAVTWALILAIPLVFLPSKKDLIAIYAVPMVLQNEKLQKLPDVLLDYIIKEFAVEKSK